MQLKTLTLAAAIALISITTGCSGTSDNPSSEGSALAQPVATESSGEGLYPDASYTCGIGLGMITLNFHHHEIQVIEVLANRHTEMVIPYELIKNIYWPINRSQKDFVMMELYQTAPKTYYDNQGRVTDTRPINQLILFPTTGACGLWPNVDTEFANRVPYLGDR